MLFIAGKEVVIFSLSEGLVPRAYPQNDSILRIRPMYHKVFPAELEHLYSMLEFIKEYGQSHHVPALALDQITLAAEEALVNIISYGYPENKGTIEITCKDSTPQRGIKIIIKDQGIPFNPIENIPNNLATSSTIPKKSNNSLGGYGIYILIGLMDRVEYQRIDGGNMLSLIKYLDT